MIYRDEHNSEHPYTMISNKLLNDRRLSDNALVFIVKFLMKPNDWNINYQTIKNETGWGSTKIYAVLDELIQLGYVVRSQQKIENGTFTSVEYVLFEKPSSEKPYTDSPLTAPPLCGNAKTGAYQKVHSEGVARAYTKTILYKTIGKKKKTSKKKEAGFAVSPTGDISPGGDVTPIGVWFSHENGEFMGITDEVMSEWVQQYPGVNIRRALTQASGWFAEKRNLPPVAHERTLHKIFARQKPMEPCRKTAYERNMETIEELVNAMYKRCDEKTAREHLDKFELDAERREVSYCDQKLSMDIEPKVFRHRLEYMIAYATSGLAANGF